MPIEMLGHNKLQDGVAQKLEALIIEMFPLRFMPDTGMRQRLRQQQRITKLVTDAFLERTHRLSF